MSSRPPWVLPVLTAASLLAGCTSQFGETHYFRSEAEPANYYRLRVHGNTFLGSARYISGYFDEDAVNDYFNEMSQPAKGEFIKRGPSSPTDKAGAATGGTDAPTAAAAKRSEMAILAEPGGGGVKPIGARAGEDNRILVMMLSSNSDEIAEQIGAFAQNRQMVATLARLLNRDRLSDQRGAARDLANETSRGKLLATLGDNMVQSLQAAEAAAPPAAPAGQATAAAEQAEEAVLLFVNRAAAELGNTEPFADLDKASEWLQNFRARLVAD